MDVAHVKTEPEAQALEPRDHTAALTAGFLGWTLDAFDFFLVVVCLTAIAKEFNRPVKDMALTLTVTLAFRPVGAFLFGLLADRYGRRLPLMIDLVFYSIFEVLSGLAPTYWTFLICRALFGIGMGGEWGVGAALAMEKVPPRLRGVLSGILQEGYAAGYLLAALCYFSVFPRWGWRPLFFIGGLPALLALFVRFRVKESEVWKKVRRPDSGAPARIISDGMPTSKLKQVIARFLAPYRFLQRWGRDVLQTLAPHWKLFIYLVLLMTMMNFVAHGTQDMYPTFLEKQWGYNPQQRSAMTALSMVGAIFGGITFGLFSDRIGRRRAMIIALVIGIGVIPLWAYAPSVTLLIAGAFLIQFMVQGAWGVIPAHLAELSPDSVRGFMPGFSYQCGVLLAGSVAYIESIFAERTSYATAMALTAATVFAAAAIVAAFGREHKGITFGEGHH